MCDAGFTKVSFEHVIEDTSNSFPSELSLLTFLAL